jgi:hypothetical protein
MLPLFDESLSGKEEPPSRSFSGISAFFAEQQACALAWVASDVMLPQDIFCCLIQNRKTSFGKLEPTAPRKMKSMTREI